MYGILTTGVVLEDRSMTDIRSKNKGDRHGQRRDLKREVTRTLDAIPSIFGRLVHVTSLRSDVTRLQQDSGLAGRCDRAELDLLLAEIHEEVFRMWLSLSLKCQHEELDGYLTSLKREKAPELATWLLLATYLEPIPARTGAADRELYRLDLELLLELLRDQFA